MNENVAPALAVGNLYLDKSEQNPALKLDYKDTFALDWGPDSLNPPYKGWQCREFCGSRECAGDSLAVAHLKLRPRPAQGVLSSTDDVLPASAHTRTGFAARRQGCAAARGTEPS